MRRNVNFWLCVAVIVPVIVGVAFAVSQTVGLFELPLVAEVLVSVAVSWVLGGLLAYGFAELLVLVTTGQRLERGWYRRGLRAAWSQWREGRRGRS